MRKRTQVQSIAIFIFTGAVIVGISCCIAWSLGLSNNWKMWKVNHASAQIVHPQNTVVISQRQDLGLLIGNGDHCDFFVGQMRSFTGSQQSITAFYAKTKIWNPLNNSRQSIDILFLENGEIVQSEREFLPSDFDSASKWLSPSHNRKQKLYIAYFFDVGHDAGTDIRCL